MGVVPGTVDEHALAGDVIPRRPRLPGAVEFAKPAVAVLMRAACAMLLLTTPVSPWAALSGDRIIAA